MILPGSYLPGITETRQAAFFTQSDDSEGEGLPNIRVMDSVFDQGFVNGIFVDSRNGSGQVVFPEGCISESGRICDEQAAATRRNIPLLHTRNHKEISMWPGTVALGKGT